MLNFERRRLTEHNRSDLVAQVRLADGDCPGCHVLSFKPTGEPRLIIVKTTTGGVATPFALTQAEEALWRARPDACRIHRLHDLGRDFRFYALRPPVDEVVRRPVEATV